MIKKGMVSALWASYRRFVLPDDATDSEVSECRDTFYSGAWALFHLIMAVAVTDGEISATDAETLEQISDELEAWERVMYCCQGNGGVWTRRQQ